MQFDELRYSLAGLGRLDLRILYSLFLQPEVGLVGGVVLENVQDKFLFNRLVHRVDVKWTETVISPLAEQRHGFWLRSRGECEIGNVRQLPDRLDLLHKFVLAVRSILLLLIEVNHGK